MSEDQLTQLFKYMKERFDKLDTELQTKATTDQVDKICQELDGITGRLDVQASEMTVFEDKVEPYLNHQYGR